MCSYKIDANDENPAPLNSYSSIHAAVSSPSYNRVMEEPYFHLQLLINIHLLIGFRSEWYTGNFHLHPSQLERRSAVTVEKNAVYSRLMFLNVYLMLVKQPIESLSTFFW